MLGLWSIFVFTLQNWRAFKQTDEVDKCHSLLIFAASWWSVLMRTSAVKCQVHCTKNSNIDRQTMFVTVWNNSAKRFNLSCWNSEKVFIRFFSISVKAKCFGKYVSRTWNIIRWRVLIPFVEYLPSDCHSYMTSVILLWAALMKGTGSSCSAAGQLLETLFDCVLPDLGSCHPPASHS